MISIVGAGGKTSLMNRLREELTSSGLKVIVTTSTHILREPDVPFAEGGNPDEVRALIDKYGYAVTGHTEKKEKSSAVKIASIGEEKLSELRSECDVMLIEADGARGKHIKFPADWEPVIYQFTDMVIAVCGADVIGKRIEDAAYRPEELAAFLGKDTYDIISGEDIVNIAKSEAGLMKAVGSRDYRFFLNAVDIHTAEGPVGFAEIIAITQRLRSEHKINASCGSLHHIDDIGAVVLAAGLGRRFGSNKLEQTVRGKPMYRHVLDELAKVVGYEAITFVTSHQSMADEAASLGVDIVINERPEDGQSSSMRLGLLNNLNKGSCLFAVADQPMITAESIRRLIDGYSSSDRCMAAMTDRKGEFANPCIFASCYYDELLAIEGDRGGKSIMRKHPDDVCKCRPYSYNELSDVDTIGELEAIKRSVRM